MNILIKLFQITVLLLASLTLAIIPWVPSLLIENMVNFTRVGLFVVAGYLVYKMMKKVHASQKKKSVYITAIYTLLLFVYIGVFALLQIGVSLAKSEYVQRYDFHHLTFYIYKTHDGGSEISIKETHLPLRSVPIASFESMSVVLKKEADILYADAEGIHTKVYDFKKNSPITETKKEKND